MTGKRDDGYHLLDSLAVFAAAADKISFTRSETFAFSVTGPFAAALASEPDNLVSRAARMLAGVSGVPLTGSLTLDKQLPVASGIGGGSADAAAALRLLCRAWRLRRVNLEVTSIASRLGADVPVCVRNRPTRMGGVGEELTPAPSLPPCGLVLVNPGIPLATASVFRVRPPVNYSPRAVLPDRWDTAADMAATLRGLTNDLEAPAIRLVPAVQDVLHAIVETRNCLLARMSGSGATCFGLYPDVQDAEAAARKLTRPEWWSWGGPLAP